LEKLRQISAGEINKKNDKMAVLRGFCVKNDEKGKRKSEQYVHIFYQFSLTICKIAIVQ